MKKYEGLKRLAQLASPGPWIEDDGNIFSCPLNERRDEIIMKRILDEERVFHTDDNSALGGFPLGFVAQCNQSLPNFDADANFIAAASPFVILKLIKELEDAKKKLK